MAQVLKPFDLAQFRIPHSLQWLNLTPSERQPVQFIISGVSSGALNISLHFSAVAILSALSSFTVAFHASQVEQSSPQQAIIFSILVFFKFISHLFKPPLWVGGTIIFHTVDISPLGVGGKLCLNYDHPIAMSLHHRA